jgi:hypothetical protein
MFVLRHVPARRSMMHTHPPIVPPVRSAKGTLQGLLAVVIALGATQAPLAADCLEQPSSQTVQGGRWYYWRDTIDHRKCWYLQQQSSSVEGPTAQFKTVADGAASLTSFLSSLFASRAVSKALPQQDAATVATAPASSADFGAPKSSRSPSPSYERRRFALRAKRTDGLAQADQKKSGGGDQQYLDPAQREALFQEYLRWAAWQDQAQIFGAQ